MIQDVNGRFDDYSIIFKIRQILLNWEYDLVENDLLRFIFLFIWFMFLFWQELFQKAIDRCHNYGSKENAAKY